MQKTQLLLLLVENIAFELQCNILAVDEDFFPHTDSLHGYYTKHYTVQVIVGNITEKLVLSFLYKCGSFHKFKCRHTVLLQEN